MRHRIVLFLFIVLVLPLAAFAQSVRWEPSDSDPSELTLLFENCSPDGAPTLPAVEGAQFALTGQATRTEFNNFRRTDYVQLNFRFRARANTAVSIPAFTVKTDKGALPVAAFTTTSGSRSSALDNAANSQLATGSVSVWAGEIFPLTYTLQVTRRNFSNLAGLPDWTAAPLVAEDWSKPDLGEFISNGEARLNIAYKTRAYAKTAGPLALSGVKQLVNLQTGSIGFGIFQTPRIEQAAVESNRPAITVRELPAPAPAGFGGAVGQFKLVSKIVPEKAAVGEPITWTLELSGSGNWPDLAGLPSREVSSDFQVVQPKAKRTPAEGKLFDVTLAEDVVLLPTKAGSYALGPVNFVYFDPKNGGYKTVTAPRTTLTITAPSAPQFNVTPPVAGNSPTEIEAAAAAGKPSGPRTPPTAPAPPAGIPRDPLPGSALASAPLDTPTLILFLLSPFALLLLFWLALAIRRARETDPVRTRREARTRLTATLIALRTAGETERRALLLRWQHDSAMLWQIAHAAPPATALADDTWNTLWAESDRALYSAKTELPSDWVARAEAAVEAKRVAGFQPLRLFLPRNLFPFAALLLAAAIVVPTSLRSADSPVAKSAANPIADYAAGKFSAAEKSWRASLVAAPTDWIARHNLSLALSQQDRAGEAAAHAAAAFVQNPAHPSVRWHFALASEKAGFVPASLTAFLQDRPVGQLARAASPAMWQRVLIAAAVLAALSLAVFLGNGYSPRGRAVSFIATSALVLAVLVAATAVIGWQAYGPAADARAVVVWKAGTLRSIPTEADTTQKTTPVAAGSVALAGKNFLGRWVQLSFENGQTGWLRQEEIIPLWK